MLFETLDGKWISIKDETQALSLIKELFPPAHLERQAVYEAIANKNMRTLVGWFSFQELNQRDVGDNFQEQKIEIQNQKPQTPTSKPEHKKEEDVPQFSRMTL